MTRLGTPRPTRSARPAPDQGPSNRPGRIRIPSGLAPALGAVGIGAALAVGQVAIVKGIDALLPEVKNISSFNRPGTLTILSDDGQVVLKQGPATREKLPSGKMPALLEEAFIAAEDRRFYKHDGLDPLGIGRAMVRNISRGSVEEGASTITQQLARIVFLSQDLSLWRKIKEAALAGKLERQLSKKQILEQYLNLVYLGSSAYGVSDAAWIYFSKTPDQLTLPEAAMIAGLPPAPSVYSPLVNPDLALQRRSIVLRRMREAGFIDAAQEAEAEAAPLGLKPADPKYFTSRAPWYTSWLISELPKVLTKEQLELGGLTIRSGLHQAWQDEAQKTIDTYAGGSMEGALVMMEPGTGLVRAMVGGKDFDRSQFNRATQALRSPGSTFKLFAYTAALKYGLKPEDSIANTKQCFGGFCVQAKGPASTSIVQAVVHSYNAAAVATARKVGYKRVIGVARDFGITSKLGEYPSMVIGANEQYALDMTAAYAAINNRGIYVKPTPFEEIYGPDGELIWSRRVDAKPSRRAVSSEVADAMQWMLLQAVRAGTGAPAGLADRPVAGKTGTSEGARDLWFIGSIPQFTTGIWLGYDNNRKTGSSSAAAAAAWHSFMNRVVKGLPVEEFPPKPELTGRFIPPKEEKSKPDPARERQEAAPRRWEPEDEIEPLDDDPDIEIPEWTPPEPQEEREQPAALRRSRPPVVEEAPVQEPSRPRRTPRPPVQSAPTEPQPAQSAAPSSSAPAPREAPAAPPPPPPRLPEPVPLRPPPPVSAPPPVP